VRQIPKDCEIQLYIHCRRCLTDRPPGVTGREWEQLEVGWTDYGLQVWCARHERDSSESRFAGWKLSIIHVDFEGRAHPLRESPPARVH